MGSMRPGGGCAGGSAARYLPFSNIQNVHKHSGSDTDESSGEELSREERYALRHTARAEPQGQEQRSPRHPAEEVGGRKGAGCGGGTTAGSNRSSLDVSGSSGALVVHADSRLNPREASQSPYHTLKRDDKKKPSCIPVPVAHAGYIDIAGQRMYTSPPRPIRQPPAPHTQELTEIPDDFLDGSTVLKHLAREAAASPAHHPDLDLSCSQPDLSLAGSGVGGAALAGEVSEETGLLAALDELAHENRMLKRQLTDACGKVARTDKLQEEVEKVRAAHEELVRAGERRERLERAARLRLQADCRRLHELARALRDQLAAAHPDTLAAQLVAQNKELTVAKERQEVELGAQRATLHEQRTHIDILDTALGNAQADALRLEHEVSGYAARVAGLQRALGSLQQAAERRELAERKLRAQLERELSALRERGCICGVAAPQGEEAELRRLLRERDQRLLQLETECAEWQQRYVRDTQCDTQCDRELGNRDTRMRVLTKPTHVAAYDNATTVREELVGLCGSSGGSFSSAETGSARYRTLRAYTPAGADNNSGYESLRLEEQLAALDARLDSARAPPARTLCCFGRGARGRRGLLGLGAGRGAGAARGEDALLLEERRPPPPRAASLPPPPPRPLRKPAAAASAAAVHYTRLDTRKDSSGSGSLGSRASPLLYDRRAPTPTPPLQRGASPSARPPLHRRSSTLNNYRIHL